MQRKSLGRVNGQDVQHMREEYKQEAEDQWRSEWALYNPDNSKKLIADSTLFFYRKKREINYYTMQILIGYRIFNLYWYRICKKSPTRYWDCGDDQDDAEHVLFKCSRWVVERAAFETDYGAEMKTDNDVITKVARDDGPWKRFTRFCTKAMKAKEKEDEGRTGRRGRWRR